MASQRHQRRRAISNRPTAPLPRRSLRHRLAGLVILGLIPLAAAAQSGTASLEFSVRAAPTEGRPEKVMKQRFYLLRESLGEIEALVRQEVPAPELNAFIEELHQSPELQAWMKRTQIVDLRGAEFLRAVTVDDIMTVPELKLAYVTRNQIMLGLGFPKRKAKPSDQEKNPKKWEESEAKYWREVKDYATLHPESKEGMDEHLLHITAAAEWANRQQRYAQEARQAALRLVHARYLVARTETDYEGFGRFRELVPGRYWLTTLWDEVRAGDVRLRWEIPVNLAAGQTVYLELNNANARLQ